MPPEFHYFSSGYFHTPKHRRKVIVLMIRFESPMFHCAMLMLDAFGS